MELAVALTASLTNPDIGDLFLDETGDAVALTELGAEVAQRLTVRFCFFRGEWHLDLLAGTPWFQYIFTKVPSDQIIRTVLSRVILDCEGVASLQSLTYDISAARVMSVRFKARLDDGSLLRSTDYASFHVGLLGPDGSATDLQDR
jgi:hypothetical protein